MIRVGDVVRAPSGAECKVLAVTETEAVIEYPVGPPLSLRLDVLRRVTPSSSHPLTREQAEARIRGHVHHFDSHHWLDYGCECGTTYVSQPADADLGACREAHVQHLLDLMFGE
jgi:hypothetical protein